MFASRVAIACVLCCSLWSLLGCDEDRPTSSEAEPAAASEPTATESAAPTSSSLPADAALSGDPQRGGALVRKHECNRCHDGTGLEPASFESHCFQCHEDIVSGDFTIADAAKLAEWKDNVRHVQRAPSLEGASRRFETVWLSAFLREPTDLRPHLVASMPRLGLTAQEAADIAAHLTAEADAEPLSLAEASVERGRSVLETRGCGSCHEMSGVPALPTRPVSEPAKLLPAVELAPDLRFARDRLSARAIVAWLKDPKGIKPTTLMPNLGLSDAEARDAARYILSAPLEAPTPYEVPARLPPLERKVSFAEVQERVLGKICAHCHGNPDVARGDGGPGNTGGFGFDPLRLDLSKYAGVASG